MMYDDDDALEVQNELVALETCHVLEGAELRLLVSFGPVSVSV